VYDSFGNILTETNASNGDRFKFAGMEYDSTTGQYYDHARYYNPATGTFVSQDPSGFQSGDANLFRYVSNSPVDSTDPTGLQQNDGDQGAQEAKEGYLAGLHAANLDYTLTFDYEVRLPATLRALARVAQDKVAVLILREKIARAALARAIAAADAAAAKLAAERAQLAKLVIMWANDLAAEDEVNDQKEALLDVQNQLTYAIGQRRAAETAERAAGEAARSAAIEAQNLMKQTISSAEQNSRTSHQIPVTGRINTNGGQEPAPPPKPPPAKIH
jgi:RHS repeat-associated protein